MFGAVAAPVGGPIAKAALGAYIAVVASAPARRLKSRDDIPAVDAWRRAHISDDVVDHLLTPFLSGVVLEREITTSRRYVDLVMRMFARGRTVVPARGMQQMPEQLARGLPDVRLDTPANAVQADRVETASGSVSARAVVVATDAASASALLPGALPEVDWRGVTTVYHAAPSPPVASPTLVVDADGSAISNTVVMTAAAPEYSSDGRALVSTSLVHGLGRLDVQESVVRRMLGDVYHTDTGEWEHVATYDVPLALPAMPAPHPMRRNVRIDSGGERLYVGVTTGIQLDPGGAGLGTAMRGGCARRPSLNVFDQGEAVMSQLSSLVDTALDRTVVGGYTKLGYALRRRSWPADDPSPGSMSGRTVLVTGANSGLGKATAARLAALGATVHLLVRDQERGEAARRDILDDVPGAAILVTRLDVSSLDNVRAVGADLVRRLPLVDVLVHNAGVMPEPRQESVDGHELSLATHVLGPLLLTEVLRPSLAAANGRVVQVSSGGMYAQALPAADPEYVHGVYKAATAYARSKRIQVAVTPLMQERWRSDGITVHTMHPGWVDTPGIATSLPLFHKLTGPLLRSAETGADTVVWLAATRPTPPGGRFWQDRRTRPTHYLRSTRESEVDRQAVWASASPQAASPDVPYPSLLSGGSCTAEMLDGAGGPIERCGRPH